MINTAPNSSLKTPFMKTLLLVIISAIAFIQQADCTVKDAVKDLKVTKISEFQTTVTNYSTLALNSSAMSAIFEKLFHNYDMNVIPADGRSPLDISTGLFINDMVPLESMNMHYSMDIYFRQYWTDFRLKFDHLLPDNINDTYQPDPNNVKAFALESSFLDRIWKPDLFFSLVKKGNLATITKPNKLARLTSKGEIFYSQRLTLNVFCEMDLHAFPFDKQTCPFYIESYSYSNAQITLDWKGTTPIIPPKFKNMLEFTFVNFTYTRDLLDYGLGDAFYRLAIYFKFSRNIQYYILQIYVPAILIVILSWVGFWIDYRSTPARVALGITTVLTMITFSKSVRNILPFVNYSKLVDIYLLVCFFYVFMGLVEYAAVGVIDQKWKQKLEGLSNKFFGPDSDKKKNAATSNEIEFNQIAKSFSFTSILEEENCVKSAPVDQQEVVGFGVVGYSSKSPRSGGGNGEILQRQQSGLSELHLGTQLSPLPSLNGLDNNGIELEDGDSTNHRARITTNRSISDYSLDLNMSSTQNTPRGFLNSSINSTNTTTNNKLIDRRKKKHFEKFRSTKRRMSARLLHEQKKNLEVHIIDKISRYMYPISFAIFNLIYFTYAFVHRYGDNDETI